MATVSEVKIELILLKSSFFNISQKDLKKIEGLAFNSVYEDEIHSVLKNKWHESNWLFSAIGSISGIFLMIKKILTWYL